MLVCVGMYLPLETTFAIFLGGIVRWIADTTVRRRKFNDAQKARVSNTGVLVAAGLIAGEALMGLVFAALAFANAKVPAVFQNPSFITSIFVFLIIGFVMVYYPVKNAGDPDAPPPPSAVM